MKWASTVAIGSPLETIVDEATAAIGAALGTGAPDLLVVFVSEHFQPQYDRIPELLARRLTPGALLGCSAGGVIGGATEIERQPAISLTGARLPGVDVRPFLLEASDLDSEGLSGDSAPPGVSAPPGIGAHVASWRRIIGVPVEVDPHILLLPDPFTVDVEALLRGLDAALPSATKIGGLASGGHQPGTNALYVGDRVARAGLAGVALSGDVAVDAIVAQGCRPIGEPMFVTACEDNVIAELDGRRPIEVIQELYQRSPDRDRRLFRGSLFLGIVMREQQHAYAQGDFLIRNILGADERSGRVAAGAMLREGMVVQYHLRDAHTSTEDLRQMLDSYVRHPRATSPAGSLLFACLGRGAGLYGEVNHDSDEFRRYLGEVPLGGFFCNGEIGPVQGTAFLHGYTSSFGVFRRRDG